MLLVLGIIWFLIVLVADLYSDYQKWLDKRVVNHTLEGWERGIFLLPSIAFIGFYFDGNILKYVDLTLLEAFIYWTLFDGLYNKLRGFDWWFFGSFGDPGGDAKLDVLQAKLGLIGTKILKFGGILITLILFII